MISNPRPTEGGNIPWPNDDEEHQSSLARRATLQTVNRLQTSYRQDVPAAVAAVARLRREAGREAHASPTGWGLDHLQALFELRERETSAGDGTSQGISRSGERRQQERWVEREDTAIHLAVTLWALHQQSLRDEPMHVPGWSLGRAVRRLAQGKTGVQDHAAASGSVGPTEDAAENDGGGRRGTDLVEEVNPTVRKRFVRIGTSSDIDTLSFRLRGMVLLLRKARIPLDYGRLADDLFRWQDAWQQGAVKRAWGRDFHRTYRKTPASGDQQEALASVSRALDFLDTDDAGE